MNQRIVITGSCGLVGSGLIPFLRKQGNEVRHLDIAEHGDARGDVRDLDQVRAAVDGCDGVIHLAAVSRVIWGEQYPDLCRETNVGGVRNILEAAATSDRKPWVVSASSREVYGQPEQLPAEEDCPLQPVNVYGHCKVEGEQLVEAARRDGVRACTVRLSNVFGSTADHADRVIPAFAHAAAFGHELRVDGADHTFDFTHITDVAAGIASLAALLADGGSPPPPIHFVSGVPTTLEQLAQLTIRLAVSTSIIRYAPPRNYDVARFVGNYDRVKGLLGWSPQMSLEAGLEKLISDFREEFCAVQIQEIAS